MEIRAFSRTNVKQIEKHIYVCHSNVGRFICKYMTYSDPLEPVNLYLFLKLHSAIQFNIKLSEVHWNVTQHPPSFFCWEPHMMRVIYWFACQSLKENASNQMLNRNVQKLLTDVLSLPELRIDRSGDSVPFGIQIVADFHRVARFLLVIIIVHGRLEDEGVLALRIPHPLHALVSRLHKHLLVGIHIVPHLLVDGQPGNLVKINLQVATELDN